MTTQEMESLAAFITNKVMPFNPDGFTVNPISKVIPRFKKDEYCVSLQGHEERFATPVQAMDIKYWLMQNGHALTSNRYIGGWLDEVNNEFVLDISISVIGMNNAITIAEKNNQDAVYWFHGKETIYLEKRYVA